MRSSPVPSGDAATTTTPSAVPFSGVIKIMFVLVFVVCSCLVHATAAAAATTVAETTTSSTIQSIEAERQQEQKQQHLKQREGRQQQRRRQLTRDDVIEILGRRKLEEFEDKHMLKRGIPLHYQHKVYGENKLEAGGKWFELDAAIEIDMGHTVCVHNGIQDTLCPPSFVRRGKNDDGDIYVVAMDPKTMEVSNVVIVFATGRIMELVDLDPATGLFATIDESDFDPTRAEEYLAALLSEDDMADSLWQPNPLEVFPAEWIQEQHKAWEEEHQRQKAKERGEGSSRKNRRRYANRRRARITKKVEATKPKQHHGGNGNTKTGASTDTNTVTRFLRNHQGNRKMPDDDPTVVVGTAREPCQEFYQLEVAVAYDSSFCGYYGSKEAADTQAQAIMEYVSALYEQGGMCIKVHLVELESNCDPEKDPYREMIEMNKSGCGDEYGLLDAFQDFWNDERKSIHRDVAHLFGGSPLECSEDNYCMVGCSKVGTWCDLTHAYGVDYITKTDDPILQSILVTHELGHNGGAHHIENVVGVHIMYPDTGGAGQTWSDQSLQSIYETISMTECLLPCRTDDDCDDGNLCNGHETCDVETGLCNYDDAEEDEDHEQQQQQQQRLQHQPPILPHDMSCQDRSFCNGSETCDPLTGQCHPAISRKDDMPISNVCDDGVSCNGVEVCNEDTKSCSAGVPICSEIELSLIDNVVAYTEVNGYFFDLHANDHDSNYYNNDNNNNKDGEGRHHDDRDRVGVEIASIQVSPNGPGTVQVFMRQDDEKNSNTKGSLSAKGRETSNEGWDEILSVPVGSGNVATVTLSFNPPIYIPSGKTIGFFIYSPGGIWPTEYDTTTDSDTATNIEPYQINYDMSTFDLSVSYSKSVPGLFSEEYFPLPLDPNGMKIVYKLVDEST